MKEIPAGAVTFSDKVDFTLLGEALPERALAPPPADLFGIMAHPGGFLVGFSGKRVYRSEVFKPTAGRTTRRWPTRSWAAPSWARPQ